MVPGALFLGCNTWSVCTVASFKAFMPLSSLWLDYLALETALPRENCGHMFTLRRSHACSVTKGGEACW